ncbi:MAG: regulatory protein RecX [Candidatus Levyibacteriota bacterium]
MEIDSFEKYWNSSLKFLSYRPRSEKEVRDNLLKKKATQEVIEAVIKRLKGHKFINDEEFASWFVRSRIGVKPKAARIIKMELKQKGISEETIDNLQFTIDDLENAKKLLEKKVERYKNLERNEIYNKLGSFLARRGFDWDTVKKAIDGVIFESH